MKKLISLFLILVMLSAPLCMTSAAANSGTVYYVDAFGGNDLNSGTSEGAAWKTLSRASEVTYAPGDKLLLKAGSIFNECFTAMGGGTAEAPVIFGSYGDISALGKPIIRCDENDAVLITLHNVCGWTVENIEFTAPNGNGIYITSDFHGVTSSITVKNCVFHDISNKQYTNHNGGHCPILIKSTGQYARIRNICIRDCNIYNCAFGIKTGGLNREMNPDHFVSPEASYNTHFLFERLSLNNILYDGIIICAVHDLAIRDCSLINTSIRNDFYTAPMWSHHACHYVIENCEIAGATNEKDGMAIDFDGWTTDATCQYIYSHDNVRFINNCCYDNYTKNRNCTVRYCLSVNDNKAKNRMANIMSVAAVDYAKDEYAKSMDSFKFYNNTLINCSEIDCDGLSNSVIANNIFVGKSILDAVKSADLRSNANGSGKSLFTFNGKFTNNCFWNITMGCVTKNPYIFDPKFVGTDTGDKNSYMLSSRSMLLKKGVQVEADMGDHDFYGNALTGTHNIGCYDGAGIGAPKTSFIQELCDRLNSIFKIGR